MPPVQFEAERLPFLALLEQLHQCMLERRKLIGIVACVIQQLLHQRLFDSGFPDLEGAANGFLDLLAGQPRNQILCPAESFRESGEAGALSEKLRSHRQNDEDRNREILACPEDQAHEVRRLALGRIGARRITNPEDLLELVHHQQKVFALALEVLTHQIHQRRAVLAEACRDPGSRFRNCHSIRLAKCVGQTVDRSRPRPHHRDFPARGGAAQVSAVERGKQAGFHQRRLATARRADNAHEAMSSENAEELLCVLLPSVEQKRLMWFERAHADERIPHAGDERRHRSGLRSGARKGSRLPPGCSRVSWGGNSRRVPSSGAPGITAAERYGFPARWMRIARM